MIGPAMPGPGDLARWPQTFNQIHVPPIGDFAPGTVDEE
jgi:hypothetical protein